MRVSGLCLLSVLTAAYLPGIAPHDYEEFSPIDLYMNKLDSSETQLPFEYYYLNFCKPDQVKSRPENLGQILQGDRIESSPYQILMNKNETCVRLCSKKNSKMDEENFKWMIENEYRSSWIMDNLPAGLRYTRVVDGVPTSRISFYQDGFPIGFKENGKTYVYNHVHIVVKILPMHKQDTTDSESKASTWRVVGLLVDPMSLEGNNGEDRCHTHQFKEFLDNLRYLPEEIATPSSIDWTPIQKFMQFPAQELQKSINFTYSISFEESDVLWASRWDNYLYNGGKESQEVHWLSIVNSFAMVLFLSGMVAHILRRALKKDIALYNSHADLDEVEETGWKQVHGDVFRPPKYSGLFSIVIGSGMQLIGMCVLTLIFASLGFLSPAHRGGLITTMLLLFVLMGVFSGYTSARLYKLFGGEHWKKNALGSAVFLPGACFSVFFIINLFIWGEESTGAVPFVHLLSILVLWIGVSVPLVFLGSAIGYKKVTLTCPCKVARIPKPLTLIPGAAKLQAICILAGSLPFGCMFIELSYVMKSLWHHTLFYYFFGFLFLCFLVLTITSAEVSILMTYILLCKEDYRWWWLSFGVAGSSGLYLFAYSIVYFLTQLTLTRLSSLVIYFGYMLVASGAYALVTGTIGFSATFLFMRTIYALIKVE